MGRARTPPIAVWGPRGGPARRDAPLSAPCAGRHMRGKTRVACNCRAPAAPSCRCPSPAEESRGRGCHTASSRKTRVAHRRGSRSPRGRHGTKRGKSPGALQSHCRAPSGWDPEVRRWEPLAPYEPPRTGGRRWKGQDLSPTILHICTVYKQNVWLGEEGNKRYAPRCPRGSGSKIPFEIPIHSTYQVLRGPTSYHADHFSDRLSQMTHRRTCSSGIIPASVICLRASPSGSSFCT